LVDLGKQRHSGALVRAVVRAARGDGARRAPGFFLDLFFPAFFPGLFCLGFLRNAMSDRAELLESALDSLPEGVAVFSDGDEVMWWNHAAEEITGYAGMDLLARPVPEELDALRFEGPRLVEVQPGAHGGRALVHVKHKLGHDVPLMARMMVLRDGMGGRIGTAAVFHPADGLDALPHGETGDDEDVAASQAELEDRLSAEFEDFLRGGPAFGVLWIGVDQAHGLRGTHGTAAGHALLEKVRRAMAAGLRPSEEIGRWGEDEFLVIAHERSGEMLAAHAQRLAGLARTADFRWWGDRLSVTVSIGAAQTLRGCDEGLAEVLERAKKAMEASIHAGGNHITYAAGDQTCLPS
jgi:diguanylate cyclase (GGDEF)-like protein/PAS domain S-box-containing protein